MLYFSYEINEFYTDTVHFVTYLHQLILLVRKKPTVAFTVNPKSIILGNCRERENFLEGKLIVPLLFYPPKKEIYLS